MRQKSTADEALLLSAKPKRKTPSLSPVHRSNAVDKLGLG